MAAETERREVRIGDEHYVLRPFGGFKALLMLEKLADVVDLVPEIQGDITDAMNKHRDATMMEIPRNVFEMRYPEDAKEISEKGWSEAGQVIRVPDPSAPEMDGMQVLMTILPKVLKLARNEVIEMLSLVVIKDAELRRADEEDTVEEALGTQGKQLLYEGSLEELADLGLGASALIQEQFSGKVGELVGSLTGLLQSKDDLADETVMPDMPETSKETSSTFSPESTDGPDKKPSGTGGMTSSPSVTV